MGHLQVTKMDDLKIATAVLAGIVIDSALQFPYDGTKEDHGRSELRIEQGLGLDAMKALEEIYGPLHIEVSSITHEMCAWFGDYDDGTKMGRGKTPHEAVMELLEYYV